MGVGYGIALEFAKAGYDVAIHHSPSSRESAKELCERMESYGAKTLMMEGDLTDTSVMKTMFERIEKEFGYLNVYVNNAGITRGGQVISIKEEEFDRVLNVNLKAFYFGMKYAARMMVRHGIEGDILTILSNTMLFKIGGLSLYTCGKMAMSKMVEVASVELAPYGIRVNGIAPGYVDTGAERMGPKEPTYDSIPMRRWVTPEEMGQTALFLVGPWTRSIDGHVLVIDGGASLAQMTRGDVARERAFKALDEAVNGAK